MRRIAQKDRNSAPCAHPNITTFSDFKYALVGPSILLKGAKRRSAWPTALMANFLEGNKNTLRLRPSRPCEGHGAYSLNVSVHLREERPRKRLSNTVSIFELDAETERDYGALAMDPALLDLPGSPLVALGAKHAGS